MTFDEEIGSQLEALRQEGRDLAGPELARNFEERAWLLVTMQRLEEALELFEEQDEIYASLGDEVARAGCWRDQSDVLRGLGRFEEALLLLDRYEAVCAATGDEAGLALAREARAGIAAGHEQPVGARDKRR